MSTAGTRIVDKFKVVAATAPNNYTGAASTSAWVNLKNYYHATILIQTGAWAGGTAAVTLNQATDTAGTGSKALAIENVFTSTTSNDAVTMTAVTSNTFNLTAANTLYVIEINCTDLDKNNNFVALQAAIATPGSNADYYSVTILLGNVPRFGGNYAIMPSALS